MSTLRRKAEMLPKVVARVLATEPAREHAVETADAPPSSVPLPDRLGFWLRLAQQQAFDAFHRAMAPLGLTPARLAVLLMLEDQPGLRQAALAEALRVKPPNLAVLLAGMENDGLIRRAEDARNRRANTLRLTPAGRALLKRAKVKEALVEAELCAGMAAGEKDALLGALRRIAGAA